MPTRSPKADTASLLVTNPLRVKTAFRSTIATCARRFLAGIHEKPPWRPISDEEFATWRGPQRDHSDAPQIMRNDATPRGTTLMTTQPDLTMLQQRLERLERRQRLWQLVALVALSTAGLAGLMGAVTKEYPALEARELRLRDREGRTRMLLMLTAEGHPKLLMLDPEGQPRAQYGSESLTFEEFGKPCVTLTNNNSLTFYGADGRPRSSFSEDSSGAFLKLIHGPKHTFARYGVAANGQIFATEARPAPLPAETAGK